MGVWSADNNTLWRFGSMIRPKYLLIAGGMLSALISILHILLALKPEYYRYIPQVRKPLWLK